MSVVVGGVSGKLGLERFDLDVLLSFVLRIRIIGIRHGFVFLQLPFSLCF
jgi:hypothetical protein